MERSNSSNIRSVLIGFIVSVFLSMSSVCSALDFIWTQKADMPTPRWSHTSVVVNGKIYVIGGGSSESDFQMLSTVEEYDPATDTWTRKADIPAARGWISPSSAVVDGKIYVIGGNDDVWCLPTVEEYDLATDTWTRKADMPTGRDSLATVAVDGKIYAIGGSPSSPTGLSIVEQYDPATDTWTRKADMPTGVWAPCANVVNGKIYALGGRPRYYAIPTVQEYDPATDTWTLKADMPVGTSQMVSVVLDDKIIVIGGWDISSNYPYTTVQMYDPETDTWTIHDDTPFLRSCFSADVVNGRIYAIGGTDRPHPCPAISTVFEFGPVLDLNWDGIVDSIDMCILVNNWQKDNPLYDIAPLPFGDGIVDVRDLITLAEHLFEEILSVELIGHWKLDEDEGDIANNSIDDNHGILSGKPTWQIDSGQVAGALEFDGIDDYVSTDPVLNPANGVFSVVVWVKGGAPGQVILSQTGASNWLCTDSVVGYLVTQLKGSGRSAGPLISQTIITDGNWHRIGFVWDGLHRMLYVDGVVVAEDIHNGLVGSNNGLYIGCGTSRESGTFFSGMIDDIRIYNRVVSP